MGCWVNEQKRLSRRRDKLRARLDGKIHDDLRADVERQLRGVESELARVNAIVAGAPVMRTDGSNQETSMSRPLTDGERRAEARLRRNARLEHMPFNRHDAQAYASAMSEDFAPGDAMHHLMGDDGEPIGSTCPNCRGFGATHDRDLDAVKACDVCGGEGVVEIKKVNAKDAEALRSKLGYYGGSSRNKPPREAAAPFQPPPKGGTPRDEEAQVEGAAAAHRDGRLIADGKGRTRIGSNTTPMPHTQVTGQQPIGGLESFALIPDSLKSNGQTSPQRVDAARRARAARMEQMPFNRADANSFVERLRADGWPGRKK